MAPVMAKLWKHHETWDGTYNLTDLLDVQEMLLVQQENQRRAKEASKAEADNR